MLLTEAMAHSKDEKLKLHIAFMDASKAFDVVDHDGILNHLQDQGISSSNTLWHLFDDLYTDITSVIKWQRATSEPLQESQGIRQGSRTSTGNYKVQANPCLNRLLNHLSMPSPLVL